MDPKIWGPKLWFISHSIAFNYPDVPTETDKLNHIQWFNLYKTMIMCEVCKQHYSDHIQKKPIENNLDSKTSLIKWVWELHNSVNESLGKNIWTYEQMYEHYSKIFSQKCSINANKCAPPTPPPIPEKCSMKNSLNVVFLICMNVVIIGILILIYFRNKK